MQNMLKCLQDKYKVVVPTPALVRKAGATATARHISEETGVLIRQQLSHSSQTDLRFYQAIHELHMPQQHPNNLSNGF